MGDITFEIIVIIAHVPYIEGPAFNKRWRSVR